MKVDQKNGNSSHLNSKTMHKKIPMMIAMNSFHALYVKEQKIKLEMWNMTDARNGSGHRVNTNKHTKKYITKQIIKL